MSERLEADVVVIGAGSAGCVVANRLSADSTRRVILLEAGTTGRSFIGDIPGFTMKLMGNPRTDWCHQAEPDPTLNQRSLVWHAGKMLGGGSGMNGLVYIRGLKRDFDEWAQSGCDGWSWNEVLPYFRRAECSQETIPNSLGIDGPVGISRIRTPHPLAGRFVEACAQVGLPTLADYNDGGGEGAFFNLTNQRNGQRESSAKSYILPVRNRPNLHVIQDALVDRMRIENGRVCAVRFSRAGTQQEIIVRGEVILSAGTVQSPAILMRSGIGPAATLRGHGIEPVVDAPEVGRNLQEHGGVMLARFVNLPTYNSEMDPLNGLRHLANYLLFRRGPLASAAVQAMAWARSSPTLHEPDIHLNFFPFGVDYNLSPPAMHKRACITLGACVSRPHSRGQVTLKSACPETGPEVRHRMLEDERDLKAFLGALRLMERILAAPALASAVTGVAGPDTTTFSDEELVAVARANAGVGLHAVGTCRMGRDAESVVDNELRVRGVAGLRVADASIMPRLISANTNAASIMIGEKASDYVGKAFLSSTTGCQV